MSSSLEVGGVRTRGRMAKIKVNNIKYSPRHCQLVLCRGVEEVLLKVSVFVHFCDDFLERNGERVT